MKKGSEIVKNKKKEEKTYFLKYQSSQSPDNLSENNRSRLQLLQSKLDNLYIHRAKGAFVHSRRKWIEEGEQNSSYFFKLEKRNHNINSVTKLCYDGVITEDPKKISEICKLFYKNLYKSQESTNDIECFF